MSEASAGIVRCRVDVVKFRQQTVLHVRGCLPMFARYQGPVHYDSGHIVPGETTTHTSLYTYAHMMSWLLAYVYDSKQSVQLQWSEFQRHISPN